MENYLTERSWSLFIHPESDCAWIEKTGTPYDDPMVMELVTDLTITEARQKRADILERWKRERKIHEVQGRSRGNG